MLLVDLIHLLPAKAIPAETQLYEWAAINLPADSRTGRNHFSPSATNLASTNLGQSVETVRLLAELPVDPKIKSADPGLHDDAAHDSYFHVLRVEGNAPEIFVRMCLKARSILLQEVLESTTRISSPFLEIIDTALVDLLCCIRGRNAGDRPGISEWQSQGQRQSVLPRWIRGHQIFAALTQGLLLSFQAMGRAVRAGNGVELRRWADLTVSLLRGSGASFVLTGDFSVSDYNESIRPSMMPPISPVCLSGLMSVDHRVLVQCIRDLKPALKYLHDHERTRHEQIHEELKLVYDRHIFVCERFVGERPSLLTAGSTEKSGAALIEQFKTMRVKPFEIAGHAVRLKPQPPAAAPALSCPFAAKQNHSPDPKP
jgi:hypothetical protein